MSGPHLALISAAATVVGAANTIGSANAQAAEAEAQSEALNRQAAERQAATAAAAADERLRLRAQNARALVRGLGRGIQPTGSHLLLDVANTREAALAAARIRARGAQQVAELRRQAQAGNLAAGAKRRSGYLSAGTSLLRQAAKPDFLENLESNF